MQEVQSTYIINDEIEVTHVLDYVNKEIEIQYSLPAPYIASVSVTELPKSTAGQTFTIAGTNFASVTNVTSTTGTVTAYVVDSVNQISVTITTNTLTGYGSVTVTTDSGTHTLSNCIRMYTKVIPGTDVAWGNITGAGIEYGAGYIRRNTTAYSTTTGGNFLVTSSTTVDVSVEMDWDPTYYALSVNNNQEWFVGPNNSAINAQANRFADMIGYWQGVPTTGASQFQYFRQNKRFFISNWENGGLKASDPLIFTNSTKFYYKRISQVDTFWLGTQPFIALKGLSNTGIYFDFCLSGYSGFKNIIAKIYD